jgi:hypothetical protein
METERDLQRLPLRCRESLQAIQQRRAQLVHRGEGQLHLRLDTGHAGYLAVSRPRGEVLQQRRLTRTRLAVHDQRPAFTGANSVQELVQDTTLGTAVGQLHRASRTGRPAGTCTTPTL